MKDEPIRWEFTQKEIEKMMFLLNEAIKEIEEHLTLNGALDNPQLTIIKHNLKQIKYDWQHKIDWNKTQGKWQ
jgi:hypothetical protein